MIVVRSGLGLLCCAQHTGMHIVVVEALLNCYLPRKRADTYRRKKTLSVECLPRAISWSLSSSTFPACSCPAGSRLSRSIPAESLRVATEARPIRNIYQSLDTLRSSYYCSGRTANIDPFCHRRPDGALRRVTRSSRPLNRYVN
jgi:hypothetical protein